MTKQQRELQRLFRTCGCKAKLLRQGGGHLVWQLERGGRSQRLVAPQTPSDHRGLLNLKAHIRRSFRQELV